MTLPADVREQVLSYARHQAAGSMADLAALMERTGAECSRCLEAVSEEQAGFRYGDEWSIKQVLGHIVEATGTVNRGIVELAAGRQAQAVGQVGETPGVERPLEDLRRAVADLWSETVRLVNSLPEDGNLERTWDHPWFGPLNFKEWIAFQRIHAVDHLRQMERLKEHPDYPKA